MSRRQRRRCRDTQRRERGVTSERRADWDPRLARSSTKTACGPFSADTKERGAPTRLRASIARLAQGTNSDQRRNVRAPAGSAWRRSGHAPETTCRSIRRARPARSRFGSPEQARSQSASRIGRDEVDPARERAAGGDGTLCSWANAGRDRSMPAATTKPAPTTIERRGNPYERQGMFSGTGPAVQRRADVTH